MGPGLVRWERFQKVAEALVASASNAPDVALPTLPVLLDRMTLPHRLLEELDADVDAVLNGDELASSGLADRLGYLGRVLPELRGTADKLAALREGGRYRAEEESVDGDAGDASSTLSFDGLVRLSTAAVLATRDRGPSAVHSALDTLLGVAVHAGTVDRFVRGMHASGAAGAAACLNELRASGHPIAASFPPMQVRKGGLPPGGIPGLGGIVGGLGLPGGVQFPGPDLEDIPGVLGGILARLRDRRHWDPETVDSRPTWRQIVGLPIPEVIDREEIRRVGCLLDLHRALTLREEPPPVLPDRVVWSESIASVTATGRCAGDRIVLHGAGFGPPRADRGVVLPTSDGCKAFAVPAADWTDTAVTVTLPPNVASGPVGFVDLAYASAYDDWATRMNELTGRILEDAKCAHAKAPDVTYVLHFHDCAPATDTNTLRAGVPVIRSFQANGRPEAYVEPGGPVVLDWDLRNVEKVTLTRVGAAGPGFGAAASVENPPGSSYHLGPFSGTEPTDAMYKLDATGPCGQVAASVRVKLRKVPVLEIDGLEVTQGIQTYRDPVAGTNSLPLVAGKDTIVRVYVAVENLGAFGGGNAWVTGELLVTMGKLFRLPPIRLAAVAHPRAKIDRRDVDSSVVFRIPAALCSGATTVTANIWARDPVEAPPTGEKVRATVSRRHFPVTWFNRTAYKVRYVRVGTPNHPPRSDAVARDWVVQAFDHLATPATDIAPARLPTWHTTLDISGLDGVEDLLDHLDDQHDCTLSEALFFWEDDCPDPDNAVWIGILPSNTFTGGVAQPHRPFDISRNTVVSAADRKTIAHELGHTLKHNHVNPGVRCLGSQFRDDEDYDTLPDGGAVAPGDAFDVRNGTVIEPPGPKEPGTYDLMTYACNRWVSRSMWQRVFNKF